MRNQFILRLADEGDGSHAWLRIEGDQATPRLGHGSLQDAAREAQMAQLVVLVPSSQVLLTAVEMPAINRQRLTKALPFALEENLVGEVEDQHFAFSDRGEDGRVSVAVVRREQMDAWQAALAEAGLHTEIMLPDVLALPEPAADEWVLMVEADGALVRDGRFGGFQCESDELDHWLRLALNEQENPPTSLRAYHEVAPPALTGLEQEVSWEPAELLRLVAQQGIAARHPLNLLQGDYSRRERWSKHLRPWRVAASLAGAWFVLQMALNIQETVVLERQLDAVKAQSWQVYKQAFPNARQAGNPRKRMEQELAKLRGAGGSDSDFLSLLADSGQAFAQTQGVVLRSIRYKNGELDVELQVPNLATLDQLKSRVAGDKLKVEIHSAAQKDDRVEGRLQIKGAAS